MISKIADQIMQPAANELIEKSCTDLFEREEEEENDEGEELSSMEKEGNTMWNDSQQEVMIDRSCHGIGGSVINSSAKSAAYASKGPHNSDCENISGCVKITATVSKGPIISAGVNSAATVLKGPYMSDLEKLATTSHHTAATASNSAQKENSDSLSAKEYEKGIPQEEKRIPLQIVWEG